MLRDGPSYATYFLTYNTICERLTDSGKKRPDWSGVMLAGGIAGMTGWAVGTPMDVIKARLQMDGAREVKQYNLSTTVDSVVTCILRCLPSDTAERVIS